MKLIRLTHTKCCTRMIAVHSDSISQTCPTCGVRFDQTSWSCESVPCPFESQSTFGCAIVVKPTRGSFLEYKSGDDLHIGISNSKSVVHSFWLNGISVEATNWDGSMVICRFNNDDDKFDQSLSSFIGCSTDRFDGQLYDDTRWNCFDFVIEFMRFTNFRNFTKLAFVSEFMQKTLNYAIKYSILVRKTIDDGVVLL